MYDGNRNIIAVYGGDKLGNLWKFDFTSPYKDESGTFPDRGWKIFNRVGASPGTPVPLFTAHDGIPPAVGAPQPITAAPRITPHGLSGIHVGFGTGKLFEPGDQISVQQQAVYVVWDKGQLPTIPKASMQGIRMQDVTFAGEIFRQLNSTDLAAYDWTNEEVPRPPKCRWDSGRRAHPVGGDLGCGCSHIHVVCTAKRWYRSVYTGRNITRLPL